MEFFFKIKDKSDNSNEFKTFETSVLNKNFNRLILLARGIFGIECLLGFLALTGILTTTPSDNMNIFILLLLSIFMMASGQYLMKTDKNFYKNFVAQFMIMFVLIFVAIATAKRFADGNTDISLFMTGILAMSITIITKPIVALVRYIAILFFFVISLSVMQVPDVAYTIYVNTGAFVAIAILCNAMIYRDQYRIFKETLEKDKANDSLYRLSTTDQLTGLSNRRRIDDVLGQVFDSTAQPSLSIILLDIDYFKRINDDYGHLIGDKVLVEVTQTMQLMLREQDVAGRWGGEEFIVICKNRSINEAVAIAERLRQAVLEKTFCEGIQMTISLGVSNLQDGESIKDLLRKADVALYKAKENGRNRVEIL